MSLSNLGAHGAKYLSIVDCVRDLSFKNGCHSRGRNSDLRSNIEKSASIVLCMHRPRNLANWSLQNRRSFPNVEEIEAASTFGVLNTLFLNGVLLDFLVRSRGSESLLVVLGGAASPMVETLPFLPGENLARRLNASLLSFSDPALALGDFNVGWYLGTPETGRLTPTLALIAHKVASCVCAHQITIVAPSGSGVAGLNFANELSRIRNPDSVNLLLLNPRLYFDREPEANLAPYLGYVHQAFKLPDQIETMLQFIEPQVSVVERNVAVKTALLQNRNDTVYYENQFMPFIEVHKTDPQLFVATPSLGRGHKPVPQELLTKILGRLATSARSAGFVSVPDYWQARFSS